MSTIARRYTLGMAWPDPLGPGRRGARAVAAVVRRACDAERPACRPDPHDRGQLCPRLGRHCFSPVVGLALPVASSSSSAESFPCTSITVRARPSSAVRRSFACRSRAFSRSSGLAAGRPALAPRASTAPRSRCLRHSEMSEVSNPSRRSSAPLPSRSARSYSARILSCTPPGTGGAGPAPAPADRGRSVPGPHHAGRRSLAQPLPSKTLLLALPAQ